MINIDKALEVLGLPPEFEAYNGQIQQRINRGYTVYENNDFSSGKNVITYTVEQRQSTELFGLYPLNYAAMMLYTGGFTLEGMTDKGYHLLQARKAVLHEPPSSRAGQVVHYVESNIYFNADRVEFTYEPYETVVNGIAEDMTNPVVRVQYKSRLLGKDATGKTVVKWTSRGTITPKKRFRRDEFLQLAGITEEQLVWNCRITYPIVPVKGETHITSVAMDIEQPTPTSVKSTVYINGIDANTFDYKKLINSFGQTYGGYMQQYRLYNGPRSIETSINVYGSTLDIGQNPTQDSTLNLQVGGSNTYNATNRTLTYNPSLVDDAKLLAYMEFLPANGKNECAGKWLSLETGIENLY